MVPEAVYQETVTEGKKELYEDAFKIEEIIENSNKRKQAERAGKGEQVLKSSGNPVLWGKVRNRH